MYCYTIMSSNPSRRTYNRVSAVERTPSEGDEEEPLQQQQQQQGLPSRPTLSGRRHRPYARVRPKAEDEEQADEEAATAGATAHTASTCNASSDMDHDDDVDDALQKVFEGKMRLKSLSLTFHTAIHRPCFA
jgi:hypothetical protein